MVTQLRRVLVGAAVLVLSIVLGVGPAWACSCVERTDAATFAAVTDVFTATALRVRDDGDDVVWLFDVDGTQKGAAAGTVEVRLARRVVEQCAFTFDAGRRYQVYAVRRDGGLRTGNCSGSRVVEGRSAAYTPSPGETFTPLGRDAQPSVFTSGGSTSPLPRVSAAAGPTVTARATPTLTPAPSATVAAAPRSDGSEQPAALWVAVAAGAALLAAAATVLVRRGRER